MAYHVGKRVCCRRSLSLKDTAILALKRGEVSAIRSVISDMLNSLSFCERLNQACMVLLIASLHNGCRYPLA